MQIQFNEMENIFKSVPDFSRENLLRYGLESRTQGGLILEFGVAEGYTLDLISKACSETVYGFDCFTGLPESWNGCSVGTFACETPTFSQSNVELVIGYFEDTLPSFLESHSGRISFLHIDSDIYSACSTIFRLLKDRIDENTVIVFDELSGYPDWENHEFKALNEFLQETDATPIWLGSTHANMQHMCMKIKF